MKSILLNDINTKGLILKEFETEKNFKKSNIIIVYIEIWSYQIGINNFISSYNQLLQLIELNN
jgi:hypothetical protein